MFTARENQFSGWKVPAVILLLSAAESHIHGGETPDRLQAFWFDLPKAPVRLESHMQFFLFCQGQDLKVRKWKIKRTDTFPLLPDSVHLHCLCKVSKKVCGLGTSNTVTH